MFILTFIFVCRLRNIGTNIEIEKIVYDAVKKGSLFLHDNFITTSSAVLPKIQTFSRGAASVPGAVNLGFHAALPNSVLPNANATPEMDSSFASASKRIVRPAPAAFDTGNAKKSRTGESPEVTKSRPFVPPRIIAPGAKDTIREQHGVGNSTLSSGGGNSAAAVSPTILFPQSPESSKPQGFQSASKLVKISPSISSLNTSSSNTIISPITPPIPRNSTASAGNSPSQPRFVTIAAGESNISIAQNRQNTSSDSIHVGSTIVHVQKQPLTTPPRTQHVVIATAQRPSHSLNTSTELIESKSSTTNKVTMINTSRVQNVSLSSVVIKPMVTNNASTSQAPNTALVDLRGVQSIASSSVSSTTSESNPKPMMVVAQNRPNIVGKPPLMVTVDHTLQNSQTQMVERAENATSPMVKLGVRPHTKARLPITETAPTVASSGASPAVPSLFQPQVLRSLQDVVARPHDRGNNPAVHAASLIQQYAPKSYTEEELRELLPKVHTPSPVKMKVSSPVKKSENPWEIDVDVFHLSQEEPVDKLNTTDLPPVVRAENVAKIAETSNESEHYQYLLSVFGSEVVETSEGPLKLGSLSREQQRILYAALNGENVFFTGAAGTGKSYLMRFIIEGLKREYNDHESGEAVTITAPTGIAACNIGGVTLHSWSGIGQGNGNIDKLTSDITRNANTAKRWKMVKVLVIDEISMLDGVMFEKLDNIARRLRKSKQPFGGIQLILAGDFFQLPPIGLDTDPEQELNRRQKQQQKAPPPTSGIWAMLGDSKSSKADAGTGPTKFRGGFTPPQIRSASTRIKFCFEADNWSECVTHHFVLQRVFRQQDNSFVRILNELRLGIVSTETNMKLNRAGSEVAAEIAKNTIPTQLFATNKFVDQVNQRELEKLTGERQIYKASDKGDSYWVQSLSNACPAPEHLELRVGAQVILLKNLATEDGLVNGARGYVKEFHKDEQSKTMLPVVVFTGKGGKPPIVRIIEHAEWHIEMGRVNLATRRQIPLKLAWALSIHKSQGMTIDLCDVDLRGVFEYGQAYVALSRAVSLERLRVRDFKRNVVKAHPRVIAFYQSLMSKE